MANIIQTNKKINRKQISLKKYYRLNGHFKINIDKTNWFKLSWEIHHCVLL